MREDLELQLEKDFPFMKRNKSESEHSIYSQWGCECADGWYTLIHELCQAITDRYEKEGVPVDMTVLQIKEKFASLRFYYTYEKQSAHSVQALDFFGKESIRLIPGDKNSDPSMKKLRSDIAEIVSAFESKSQEICEFCGEKGAVRKDLNWIKTLCDRCYKNCLENIEKHKAAREDRRLKLKLLKEECLEFIDSKTMRDYLAQKDDVRFSLKELLSIVYHSHQDEARKILFYRAAQEKIRLNDAEQKWIQRLISGSENVPEALMCCDENGRLTVNEDYNTYVENLYVQVPTPFRIGDVVKEYNKPKQYVVVYDKLPSGRLVRSADWSDMCVTVVPVKYKPLVLKEYSQAKQAAKNAAEEKSLLENDELFYHHDHLHVFELELVEKAE